MTTRGIRGATTITTDTVKDVLAASRELVEAILASNPDLRPEDVASVLFTVTEDILSTYPAKAVRDLGWTNVPLMCAREIPVLDSLPLCIRVLIHWNTDKSQQEIRHVYLRNAKQLRPDLVGQTKETTQ